MTDLKTLKDLASYNEYLGGTFICSEELKAEAVNWYKNLNNIDEGDWRKFFNITEEDLECEKK
jgi:hypothetical protein